MPKRITIVVQQKPHDRVLFSMVSKEPNPLEAQKKYNHTTRLPGDTLGLAESERDILTGREQNNFLTNSFFLIINLRYILIMIAIDGETRHK